MACRAGFHPRENQLEGFHLKVLCFTIALTREDFITNPPCFLFSRMLRNFAIKEKNKTIMAVFETNFNDGTGKVYINPDAGSGDATAETTADCNCGEDRTVNVAVVASSLSKKVAVNQEGVREQFIPADQEEGIMGSEGDYFLGIKAEWADNLPTECQ